MKPRFTYVLAASLLVPGLGIGKEKDKKVDPRLHRIHTVFVSGDNAAAQDIRAKQTDIEKDSCLKLVPDAETADAVLKVRYSPGRLTRSISVKGRGEAVPDVNPYHTSLELNVRDGGKMRKIWSKDIDLDDAQEQAQHGVFRLMGSLNQDACAGR